MTWELIEKFLKKLHTEGRSEDTIRGYRRNLGKLWDSLPADKRLDSEVLEAWRKRLISEGYAARTVNAASAAVNSFLQYVGRRNLQMSPVPIPSNKVRPELTRNEYLRLLQTARTLENLRVYLLIKLFGTVGLPLRALPELTAEAVQDGWVVTGDQKLRIPPCFQRELLDYLRRNGVRSGPVFVTRGGTPMTRTHVTTVIQSLARDARVAPEKCNPRCLRKLCLETQAGIRASIELLAEQTYDRMLENEQLTVGWEDSPRK